MNELNSASFNTGRVVSSIFLRRMHLTLKREVTGPPGFNRLQQQERFDGLRHEFNEGVLTRRSR